MASWALLPLLVMPRLTRAPLATPRLTRAPSPALHPPLLVVMPCLTRRALPRPGASAGAGWVGGEGGAQGGWDLHGNAAGDFLLLSAEDWRRLGGLPVLAPPSPRSHGVPRLSRFPRNASHTHTHCLSLSLKYTHSHTLTHSLSSLLTHHTAPPPLGRMVSRCFIAFLHTRTHTHTTSGGADRFEWSWKIETLLLYVYTGRDDLGLVG